MLDLPTLPPSPTVAEVRAYLNALEQALTEIHPEGDQPPLPSSLMWSEWSDYLGALEDRLFDAQESRSGTYVPVDAFPTLAENLAVDPQAKTTGDTSSNSLYALTRITTGLPAGFAHGMQTVRGGSLSTIISQHYYGVISGTDPLAWPVTPGEVYSAGAFVWASVADARIRVAVNFVNASGASIGTQQLGPISTAAQGTWERRVVEGFTVPEGAATMHLYVIAITTTGNATAGDVVRSTGAMYHEGTTLAEYGDGSFPGWVWLGTAHASASKKIFGDSGDSGGTTDATLIAWATAEAFTPTSSVVRNADGIITSASITWPDGSTGTFTATDTTGGYLNAYTATHVASGRKVTQAAVTRNTQGDVTAVPTPTVGAI